MNEKTRTHLDLFSGIGGFALAARWAGYQTIAFCEQDRFCQRVLERHWPEVPCVEDVHDLDGKDYEGVTLLTGGFPCQPFSHAGKRRGKDDDRAIGGEMVRIISEARPAWVLGENVSGFETMGLDDMLSDLESLGYACQTFIIPACALNAPHRRDRVWIIAHAANTNDSLGRASGGRSSEQPRGSDCRMVRRSWESESGICRVANGIPSRMDRLKGLGNAIVPQVAYEIIRQMA